ncbi:MAG TPA: hypothetical protein VKE51_12800 [Vicinamibacterales bacterium]|nr:hypothetical protein [Vicinamibacterales bacterium]
MTKRQRRPTSLEAIEQASRDELEVLVELDPQTPNVEPVREDAARDLQRRIKAYVGVSA